MYAGSFDSRKKSYPMLVAEDAGSSFPCLRLGIHGIRSVSSIGYLHEEIGRDQEAIATHFFIGKRPTPLTNELVS